MYRNGGDTNILLISIDTLRRDALSCYTGGETTPEIDSLAFDGVIYDRHYTTGVWTPPCHAGLLTGFYASKHGVVRDKQLSEEVYTISEILKEEGYVTLGIVNNSQVGNLVGFDRGFDVFHEVWRGDEHKSIFDRVIKGGIRRVRNYFNLEDKGADKSCRIFFDFCEKIPPDERFFCFLHFIEPHNPLKPHRSVRGNLTSSLDVGNVDLSKVKRISHNPLTCYIEKLEPNEEETNFIRSLYLEEVTYIDKVIGKIFTFMKKKGVYDKTLIILTTDHGEHFGEDGKWSHVASLDDEIIHIPLIVKYPGGPKGCRVSSLTQSVDVVPTIVDFLGLKHREEFHGVKLPFNASEEGERGFILSEWEGRVPFFIKDHLGEENETCKKLERPMTRIKTNGYEYVSDEDGNEKIMFYDNEVNNRTFNELGEETRREVEEILRHYGMRDKGELKGKERKMDEEIMRNLKSLGYL